MDTSPTSPSQLMQSLMLVGMAILAAGAVFAARWLPIDGLQAIHVGNVYLMNSGSAGIMALSSLGAMLGLGRSKADGPSPARRMVLLALLLASLVVVAFGVTVVGGSAQRFYVLDGTAWYGVGGMLTCVVADGSAGRSLRRIVDPSVESLSRAASLGMWLVTAGVAAIAFYILQGWIADGTWVKVAANLGCFGLGGLSGLHPLIGARREAMAI